MGYSYNVYVGPIVLLKESHTYDLYEISEITQDKLAPFGNEREGIAARALMPNFSDMPFVHIYSRHCDTPAVVQPDMAADMLQFRVEFSGAIEALRDANVEYAIAWAVVPYII